MTTQLLSDCCNATVLTLVACVGAAPSYSCHKCHKHPCSVHPEPERKEGDETCATQTTPSSITDSSKSTTLPVASEGAPTFDPKAAPTFEELLEQEHAKVRDTIEELRQSSIPTADDLRTIVTASDAPSAGVPVADEEPDACAFCGSADSIELWPFRSVLTPMCPACVKREAGCDPKQTLPAEATPEGETPFRMSDESNEIVDKLELHLPFSESDADSLEKDAWKACDRIRELERSLQSTARELAQVQRERDHWREANRQTLKAGEEVVRQRDEAQRKVQLACEDWADTDTRIKEIGKKYGMDVEGDSFAVPGILCVGEFLDDKIRDARNELLGVLNILSAGDGSAYEDKVVAWAVKRMDQLAAARAELAQLRERVAELEADRARLDWVIQHPSRSYNLTHTHLGGGKEEENARVRSAIDAAREGQR